MDIRTENIIVSAIIFVLIFSGRIWLFGTPSSPEAQGSLLGASIIGALAFYFGASNYLESTGAIQK